MNYELNDFISQENSVAECESNSDGKIYFLSTQYQREEQTPMGINGPAESAHNSVY